MHIRHVHRTIGGLPCSLCQVINSLPCHQAFHTPNCKKKTASSHFNKTASINLYTTSPDVRATSLANYNLRQNADKAGCQVLTGISISCCKVKECTYCCTHLIHIPQLHGEVMLHDLRKRQLRPCFMIHEKTIETIAGRNTS